MAEEFWTRRNTDVIPPKEFLLTQDEVNLINQPNIEYPSLNNKSARTGFEEFDLTTIQLKWLVRVCKVFKEGDLKYGKDNWKEGLNDTEWIRERLNHGIKHLFKAKESILNGTEITEDDLAKVIWCCFVMMDVTLLKRVY